MAERLADKFGWKLPFILSVVSTWTAYAGMFDPASDWSLIFWAGRVRCRGASSLVGHLNAISPFVRTLCRVTDVAVTDTISVAVERFVAKPVATENMDSRLLSNGGSL